MISPPGRREVLTSQPGDRLVRWGPSMTDQPQRDARWTRFANATLVMIGFAAIAVWCARPLRGRSLGFAFIINWILMAWAITLKNSHTAVGRTAHGTRLLIQLPAEFLRDASIRKNGRIYVYLGVRWAPVVATPCFLARPVNRSPLRLP